MSRSSSSSSQSKASSAFSGTTQGKIVELVGDTCWFCESIPVEACHVIAQKDPALSTIIDQKLLLTSLRDVDNGIGLCPTCHNNFDTAPDPRLVIVPTDLDFFINFEEKDYRERTLAANGGFSVPRQCPTKDQYKDHQIANGEILEGSGLYAPYILMRFYATGFKPNLSPRPWHGQPVHMIRRALIALGSLNYRNLPDGVSDKLRTLLELYTRPPPPMQERDVAAGQEKPGKLFRSNDDLDTSTAKRELSGPQTFLSGLKLERRGRESQGHTDHSMSAFTLGPECTALDAISMVMSRRQQIL
ncbi:uncharacterized protein ACHE_80450A [Aspergillus chevalieri]|uniref:HNH nuclease domain-containing protein n=1 Tax=Aspergillus chevalieri TaxID=182096 RepID=A0A7R7VXI6_ASPCH|nr:uncharacterized protein ACHE_80450A [Aspergillus chevalieri]BCR92550.1 hypothetical protein ACHE_80450A [Aspergillus chevalieri]